MRTTLPTCQQPVFFPSDGGDEWGEKEKEAKPLGDFGGLKGEATW